MMKKFDKFQILSELKSLLLNHFQDNIYKIFLFGSQVMDTADEYSDFDVLIILKNSYDRHTKNEIFSLCFEIDLKYDILLDVKIISLPELNTLRGKQPFIQNAIEHGISI